MTIYPAEQKAALMERLLPPENAQVPQLAKATGIPQDTLYDWRRQARRARGLSGPAVNGRDRWRTEEKFAMVVATAALNETECAEYCRRQGVYPDQLHAWRRACEQANAGSAAPRPRRPAARDRRRIQMLERELRRKEKALAEAAALLVLRKKADPIWGTDEDA